MLDSIGVGLQCTISKLHIRWCAQQPLLTLGEGVILVYIAGALCFVTALYGIKMQNWIDSGRNRQ